MHLLSSSIFFIRIKINKMDVILYKNSLKKRKKPSYTNEL